MYIDLVLGYNLGKSSMLVVSIWLSRLGPIVNAFLKFGIMPQMNDDRRLMFGDYNLVME